MSSSTPAVVDGSAWPPIDILSLRYTRRDWTRWDSFDMQKYSFVGKRREHTLGLDPNKSDQSAEERYFRLLKEGFIRSFYAENYKRFRGLKTNVPGHADDLHAYLQKKLELNTEALQRRASYALNQEYNHWRHATRQRIRGEILTAASSNGQQQQVDPQALQEQVDLVLDSTEWDARTHPTCAPTISWLSSLLDAHLKLQCLDPRKTDSEPNKPQNSWRCYGLWPEPDGKFVHRLLFWRTPYVHFLHGHYAHLLSDELLRRVRTACFASMSAQWSLYDQFGGAKGNFHTESQWLLRICGVGQTAFALLRCEEELRARGAWNDALDAVRRPDGAPEREPTWTNSELVSFSELVLQELQDRVSATGQVEFLSSYHCYGFELLCQMQMHTPSQRAYDLVCALMDRWRFDLLAHLLPQSGCFSGPSSRSYDLFCGVTNAHDRVDHPLECRYAFRPCCDQQTPEQRDGCCLSTLLQRECKLSDAPPSLLPASGALDPVFARCLHLHSMFAGLERPPFRLLRDLVLRSPFRVVEQRFSPERGQERYNCLTPRWQLGHAGEDAWSLPTSNLVCARLCGAPAAGCPPSVSARGGAMPANCTAMVRLFPEFGSDNPFAVTSGVAGNQRLALARQVCVQYQGFMLVTSLLAPKLEHSIADLCGSACSNLILPLQVDDLFADGVPLPRTPGSAVALPLTAVFSARHGGASVAVRLVSCSTEGDLVAAEKIQPINPIQPESGDQPYALVWRVDEQSHKAGCGRVCLMHRRKRAGAPPSSSALLRPHRSAWLFGAGRADSPAEATALAQVLRTATVRETQQAGEGWDGSNQPHNAYPSHLPPHSKTPVAEHRWEVEVGIRPLHAPNAQPLSLTVARTDVYHPWKHDPLYNRAPTGPLHRPPYFSRDVRREVNGVEQLQWREGEDPYRLTRLEEGQLYEPHRAGGCAQVFTNMPVTCYGNERL